MQRSGRSTREAWGQVAEEFPELRAGHKLVELFLVWKTVADCGILNVAVAIALERNMYMFMTQQHQSQVGGGEVTCPG